MNLFQLVLKQMRQRALGTWLTLLSVLLGVALAIAIMILRREGKSLFGQTEFGYDLIVGAKGSPLQLTLNTVYHLDKSPGNISYAFYEQLDKGAQFRPMVRSAVPFAVGDSYKGFRIVATTSKFFGFDEAGKPIEGDKALEVRPGQRYQLAGGRMFQPLKFEAIIGSDIALKTGLKLGDSFQATHGLPTGTQIPDIHEEKWIVVGILQRTHTAADAVLYIPMLTFYTIFEHEEGLEAQAKIRAGADPAEAGAPKNPVVQLPPSNPGGKAKDEGKSYEVAADGTITIKIPRADWEISGVLIKSRGAFQAENLKYMLNNRPEAQAVNPTETMQEFFNTFLSGSSLVLLLISLLVTIVAAVGILVSIYNSVSARLKEIAILRALGATRARVLSLICVEAGLIGLFGGVAGLLVGHGMALAGSIYLEGLLGQGINWLGTDRFELLYLSVVVVIAMLAGLVPAMKAYRTPVATNLMTT